MQRLKYKSEELERPELIQSYSDLVRYWHKNPGQEVDPVDCSPAMLEYLDWRKQEGADNHVDIKKMSNAELKKYVKDF